MTTWEIMRCRHYEYQQDALDKIRLLRSKIDREDNIDIAGSIDSIFKELDAKTAP